MGRGEVEVGNRLLLALAGESLARLTPDLEPVELKSRQVVHQAGARIEHLYFVNRGLVSFVKSMHDGRTVEVGAVGKSGAIGVFGVYGIERAIWESVAQAPGSALRIELAAFQREWERNEDLKRLIERYTYVVLSELAQNAACNRLHSLEERCCRWLLVAHDSAGSDTFPLTHEYLALMLGVQRSGLSIAASLLRKDGLIRYTRGQVSVTDRAGLEAAACECYAATRSQLDGLFGQPTTS